MNAPEYKISEVAYNAATKCFEAVVTIRSAAKQKSFACAIDAPITMSFEQAAEGLKRQAERNMHHDRGLRSQMRRHGVAIRAKRQGFDPRGWLDQVGLMPNTDAA